MADDSLQRLLDLEEIKQLKARYCRFVAKEDWEGFKNLFSEDLQFITPDGYMHDGRAVFMAFHEESLQKPKVWGVVHCYAPEITIIGPDSASGMWAMEDVHVWPGGDGPPIGHHGYGYYHEDYVRLPDGWRFKRIQVIYDRVDPLEGGFPPGIEH
jgi:uncharacterized protein (TIGR02246 family)